MSPSVDVVKRRRITKQEPGIIGSNGGSNNLNPVGSSTSKFMPGYLIQVKVWNFTTYTYGEFNLSPTLNMIIGPNGTGKSTLVSAICLGLGGKIDLIKRKSMKSMIKSGFEESKILITLKGREENEEFIIERKFTERESKWRLNGNRSDEKSIRKLVLSFNIQLDNLCHFLPQERVAEFAGLSPEKLLLETERTIGDGLLLSMHENLIRNDNDLVELKLKIDQTEKAYANLMEEKDRLQEEAKKYEEYQTKTQDLNNHVKLIPYAQIQDLKLKQKHLKKQRDLAKKAIEKFNSNSKPIQTELIKFEKSYDRELKELEQLGISKDSVMNEFKDQNKSKLQDKEKIAELKHAITQLKARSSRKLEELDQRKLERDEIERKIANDFPESQSHRFDEDHIESLRVSRDKKHSGLEEINRELEELERILRPKKQHFENLEQEMNENKERLTSTDKLVVLQNAIQNNRSRGGNSGGNTTELLTNTFGAHRLLRKNYLPEYRGKYFEAPVVSCEISDKRYCKYLEKVIDNNTLLCLSFNNKQYYDEVNKIVFQKYNAPMRVITKQAPQSKIPVGDIKKFGFDGYLSNFISGPVEVLNMLNEISKLNQIPVSVNPLSEAQLNKLLNGERVPFTKFLSGDNLFSISRSRYGSKQLFYTTEKVPEAKLFSSTTGLTEHAKGEIETSIRDIKSQMQNIIAEVETFKENISSLKRARLEAKDEFDTLTSQFEDIIKLKNLKVTLEGRLLTKEAQIKKLAEESNRDCSEKIVQIDARIKQKYHSIANAELENAALLRSLTEYSAQICHREFICLQWENRIATAKGFLVDLEGRKEQLQNEYAAAKAKYDEIKKSDAAKKIQEQSSSYTDEERQILGNLAAMYLDSNTLTEVNIRDKIKLIEEERSLMLTVDQSSMEALRRKLQEIEFADKELPILKSNERKLARRIELIRLEWEPQITNLIDKISQTFRKRFTSVASDGQVEIGKADRFKNWKLQILVKFRENSDLKILDHQSQSGGERAVSTIFFIMSLQGLTDAPFRVVDEINQGMDPKNEKMAHKYLVHTACANKSSQYFLVTPKLLTGLYYHPDMMIHCIYTDSNYSSDKNDKKRKSKPSDFLDFARKLAITT